jgi:beta-barrel assembly-enhancing protease
LKIVNKPLVETADVSRGGESRWAQFKNLVYVVGVLVGLYFLLGYLGSWVGAHLPDRWERKLVAWVPEKTVSEDAPRREELIFNTLTEGETLRDLNYRLFTLDMPEANAFAFPGGGIGVSDALLEEVETEIGLAFVLAHELGHHQNRHITRRLGRGLLLALASSLFGATSHLDPVQSAVNLAESGFSREQEREADRFALEMIHRKYGTTDGATEFFENLAADGKESALQKYVGSHPLTGERLADLKAYAEELANR